MPMPVADSRGNQELPRPAGSAPEPAAERMQARLDAARAELVHRDRSAGFWTSMLGLLLVGGLWLLLDMRFVLPWDWRAGALIVGGAWLAWRVVGRWRERRCGRRRE